MLPKKPIGQWGESPVFLRERHLRIDSSTQQLDILVIIISDFEVTKPLWQNLTWLNLQFSLTRHKTKCVSSVIS